VETLRDRKRVVGGEDTDPEVGPLDAGDVLVETLRLLAN